MLDFKELPKNGQAFEQLVRELLFSKGLHVQWSGNGADGGRDLICTETHNSIFAPHTKKWLVQCKHFAHANKSVGITDLDDISDSCNQHHASGYLLACSTQPSSAVVQRLEGITANTNSPIFATFWDGVTIERLLSNPRQWAIAQRFFPKSTGAWKVYATEHPNSFVAHYKGYVFQFTNRIGSEFSHSLPSVEKRIEELESLKLPKDQFIRPRAIWYDDKNGGYTFYIDYMFADNSKPRPSRAQLERALHNGYALEDGQCYSWDIRFVQYFPSSDHYDQDHYNYYTRYLSNYLEGLPRDDKDSGTEYFAYEQEIKKLEDEAKQNRDKAFNEMVASFAKIPTLKVLNSINCQIESIHKFERRFAWDDIISGSKQTNHFFNAGITFAIKNDKLLHAFLSCIPQEIDHHFSVAQRNFYYLPNGECCIDGPVYELTLEIHPVHMPNQWAVRTAYDNYFNKINKSILDYLKQLKKRK